MLLPVIATSSQFETGPRSISAVKVLRISITDRCNFRCVYCMPEAGVPWLPRDAILSYEEIVDVVKAAIDIHGITRFKLTGGEPTVRNGLVDLVGMLSKIKGIEDLSLTTNGMRLHDLADPLRQAGLHRITVSLDSLDPKKFREITRTGDLETVLRGLNRAEEAGFESLKINCVTMRRVNDDELTNFAKLSIDRNLTVRFIEYMPLGDAALMHATSDLQWSARFSGQRISDEEQGPAAGCGAQDRGEDSFISEKEVREKIESDLGELNPIDREDEPGVGPANVYRLANHNAKGRIGFISAMSAPFCSTCNRLRLTASGVLRSCLFEGGEVDIRSILRSEPNPAAKKSKLATAMTDCVRLKPEVHSMRGNEQMSRIGG